MCIVTMKMKKSEKRGKRSDGAFTLMEMLLVLAIIAMLAGMGTFLMRGVIVDAEEVKVKGDIAAFEQHLIRYKIKAGYFPTTSQGLKALHTRPTDGPQPRSWKTVSDQRVRTLRPVDQSVSISISWNSQPGFLRHLVIR